MMHPQKLLLYGKPIEACPTDRLVQWGVTLLRQLREAQYGWHPVMRECFAERLDMWFVYQDERIRRGMPLEDPFGDFA